MTASSTPPATDAAVSSLPAGAEAVLGSLGRVTEFNALAQPSQPHALPPPQASDPVAVGWLKASLLTAAAYWGIGKLSLLLAIPPGFASPLYPSAGLALAAVLVWGRRALPGVALGALAINLPLSLGRGPFTGLALALALALALVTAFGAGLQAALGAWLLRRRQAGPLTLSEPRDLVAFFLLAAVLASTLNASLSTLTLAAAGVVPAAERAYTWWTWWGGDAIGVIIGTPIALAFIGQPRADWAPRRLALALPMLIACGLMALATQQVSRLDAQRIRSTFVSDATAAGAALDAELRQALFALEALRSLHIGSDSVSPQEMQRAVEPWLTLPIPLESLGFSQRVAAGDIARFEASVALESGRPYRVFDRDEEGRRVPVAPTTEVLAVRHIEPLAGNTAGEGANMFSIAAAREAVALAVATDAAAVTSGFRMKQLADGQPRVVFYRALYAGRALHPTPAERAAAFRGVVFVGLRLQQSVTAAMRRAPSYLDWCLVDSPVTGAPQRLAGPDGCEQRATSVLHHVRQIEIGGQRWALRIAAQPGDVPSAGYSNTWLFATGGLLIAAMLAALLLIVTGRTRRIEAVVAERTAELRREVAERARTEAALRESEQRFRNIFDHAPIGIAFADLQGQLREANPKLRDMLGFGTEPLHLHTIDELVPGAPPIQQGSDSEHDHEHALVSTLRGGLPELRQDARLRRQDGSALQVRTHWSLLRGPSSDQDRLVAVIEDITEQIKGEAAEQGRLRAENANRAKSEFLSRMSHELRTPLNAMLGFAQLLDLERSGPIDSRQKAWIAQILKAGWHLLEMINDMLDVSRIEAGMMRLTLAPVALAPLVAHCAAMVAPAAALGDIRVTVHLDDSAEAARVQGDETRIKQVLSNLLSNAVKYNQPGGQVTISSRLSASHQLQIRVHDTGLGLSSAQLAELFQPFNRLGRELSDSEGTGIGLVISRRLAELMGGGIDVESQPGEGTTFALTLPLAATDAAAPVPSPANAPSAPSADADSGYRYRRVHYVEDNAVNVEVVRGLLARRPQVELTVSSLGLDALVAIRSQRPDLILLDMQLPDVHGLELLHQLMRDPVCSLIPVVAVSADATVASIEQALAAGARLYLTKPLDLDRFLKVLDDMLRATDSRFG